MKNVQVIFGPQVKVGDKAIIQRIVKETGFDLTEGSEADFHLIIGGDGTFLRMYHELCLCNKPIFGVNFGHLGFFMESSMKRLQNDLFAIKEGKHYIDEYYMIDAEITLQDGTIMKRTAINDFVLKGCKEDGRVTFGATRFEVIVDDIHLETAFGDGFIVSSPSGSTAYNRSAGGAMLHPSIKAFQLTELPNVNSTAWRSFDRPVIFDRQDLVLEPIGNAILGSDGQEVCLNPHLIKLTLSEHTVCFIRTPEFNFFKPLQRSFLNP